MADEPRLQSYDLVRAVEARNAEWVRRVLRQGFWPDYRQDKHDLPLLLTAAANGDAEIVRALVGAGADPNQWNADSCATRSDPLHEFNETYGGWSGCAAVVALAHGHPELADELAALTTGDDADYYRAVRPHVGRELTPAERGLVAAAEAGDIRLIALAIGAGATPDGVDLQGRTALHLAAMGGHFGAVVFLLDEHDADPNRRANNGHTPLTIACEWGRAGVVGPLTAAEAALEAECHGSTPLGIAVAGNNADLVRLLAGLGADVRCVRDGRRDGRTLLEWARQWWSTSPAGQKALEECGG